MGSKYPGISRTVPCALGMESHDPEILSILGIPGYSQLVPLGIEPNGSLDTKYGIPRTVLGSPTRHTVPWIPRY